MILLYFLAPLIFRTAPTVALLVPGLLWCIQKGGSRRYGAAAFFLLYAGLIYFGIDTAFLSASASILLLLYGLLTLKRPLALAPIFFLLFLQGGLLARSGAFSIDRLPRALSYLFSTLLFVLSEEIFLREWLRPRLGRGFFPALFLGILWGLWHVPLHPSAGYAFVQVLHASALSILIESVYERSGLATSVALHALHNALPLCFVSFLPPWGQCLFFGLCCLFYFLLKAITPSNLLPHYNRRKRRHTEGT